MRVVFLAAAVAAASFQLVQAQGSANLVASDSSFKREVARLIGDPPLAGVVTRAVARHNDVEIWVNRDMTSVIAAATCDQQRDFAAALWMKWSRMNVGNGAGVEIKSYTGRVIANAAEGLTGPRFHC